LGPEVLFDTWRRTSIGRIGDDQRRVPESQGVCSQGSKTRDDTMNPLKSRSAGSQEVVREEKCVSGLLKPARFFIVSG